MGDLSNDELDSIERSLGGPQLVATSKSETCRMLAELRRHRAAQSASAGRVRTLVHAEAYSVIHRGTIGAFDVSQLADAIAERVSAQLGPVGLSDADRATINWLKALAAAGVFEGIIDPVGVEHTRRCRESIALLDRLLGVTP